ncbi:hypothetical protein CAL26_21210 [Bordetella genomosp. 9]|uniref:Transcriptional regulator n=1 Tax=Bordetella genomosp. 9 TaxID=1416803 RepID=A0A261R4Y9_9BORD|nr:hypothetical protein [Bordetella genomosp. 9]OZI20076.1 hypothetical protein CAL26_21210 [Bordetella genomosp. 9]
MSAPATQVASFNAMRASGADVRQHDKIVECLRLMDRPLIKDEIVSLLHPMRVSSVTGRLTELVKAGRVKIDGTRYNPETNRNVSQYVAV